MEPTEAAKAEIFSRTGDTQVTNNYGLGDFHADFSDDYHTGFSTDYQFCPVNGALYARTHA